MPPKGVAQQLSSTIPEGGGQLHRCDLTPVITDEISDVITLPFLPEHGPLCLLITVVSLHYSAICQHIVRSIDLR